MKHSSKNVNALQISRIALFPKVQNRQIDKVSTITALKWNAATSQQCNLHGTTNLKKIGVSLEG